jgi:hypothetical protein
MSRVSAHRSDAHSPSAIKEPVPPHLADGPSRSHQYPFYFPAVLRVKARSAEYDMSERHLPRGLPLPGVYGANGECVKCGGSLPKVVRSGLAAYFCSDCWLLVLQSASHLDPVSQSNPAFGRIEDD